MYSQSLHWGFFYWKQYRHPKDDHYQVQEEADKGSSYWGQETLTHRGSDQPGHWGPKTKRLR